VDNPKREKPLTFQAYAVKLNLVVAPRDEPYKQGVSGSSPLPPTTQKSRNPLQSKGFFFCSEFGVAERLA
jgi:hypothetical protein